VDTQPELAIRTATEHERLIHHHFFTLAVRKVEIPHRDGEIAVDLDAFLGCIVIVTNLNPTLSPVENGGDFGGKAGLPSAEFSIERIVSSAILPQRLIHCLRALWVLSPVENGGASRWKIRVKMAAHMRAVR